MIKHFIFYSILVAAISALIYINHVQSLKLIHQRTWMESQRQMELADAYYYIQEYGTESAKKHLVCSMAVHSQELRGWQAKLVQVPWYHQTKEELDKIIERQFKYIKTISGAERVEEINYYENHCVTHTCVNTDGAKNITSTSTGCAKAHSVL